MRTGAIAASVRQSIASARPSQSNNSSARTGLST